MPERWKRLAGVYFTWEDAKKHALQYNRLGYKTRIVSRGKNRFYVEGVDA